MSGGENSCLFFSLVKGWRWLRNSSVDSRQDIHELSIALGLGIQRLKLLRGSRGSARMKYVYCFMIEIYQSGRSSAQLKHNSLGFAWI